MKVDKIAETIERSAPPVPEKQEKPRFLFTVKIVIAEGLVPLDSSPSAKLDTFVTLSDEQGTRLAKTRTIYETNDPRCETSFPCPCISQLILPCKLQGTKRLIFLLKRRYG